MPAEWAQAEALDSPPHPARGPGESLRQPCAECESPTTQQTWQVSAYDDRVLGLASDRRRAIAPDWIRAVHVHRLPGY